MKKHLLMLGFGMSFVAYGAVIAHADETSNQQDVSKEAPLIEEQIKGLRAKKAAMYDAMCAEDRAQLLERIKAGAEVSEEEIASFERKCASMPFDFVAAVRQLAYEIKSNNEEFGQLEKNVEPYLPKPNEMMPNDDHLEQTETE